MVYNEADKLPYWLSHYNRQVGLRHCYVIDHGTDDGSTNRMHGANRIGLPRSPQDNDRRLGFVANLAAGLLAYYRRVAYVDADELLVADPGKYRNLNDYAERMEATAVTSIGVEIVQGEGEAPLTRDSGIGMQRCSAIFSSSMCKTNMIGTPVRWAPGWHSHDGAPRFDDLYLFHLRHADLDQALRRLAVTRAMPWAREDAGRHQRRDDDWMRDIVHSFGHRTLDATTSIGAADGPMARDLAAFVADSAPGRTPQDPWSVPLARYGSPRMLIDPRFRKAISHKPY